MDYYITMAAVVLMAAYLIWAYVIKPRLKRRPAPPAEDTKCGWCGRSLAECDPQDRTTASFVLSKRVHFGCEQDAVSRNTGLLFLLAILMIPGVFLPFIFANKGQGVIKGITSWHLLPFVLLGATTISQIVRLGITVWKWRKQVEAASQDFMRDSSAVDGC